MKSIPAVSVFLFSLLTLQASAGNGPSSFSAEPNPVLRVIQAMEAHKDDQLRTKVLEDKGKRYSYHLQSVNLLGHVTIGGERYAVAAAEFLRSSPEGADMPPGRGHGFLLLMDRDYRIASYCRLDSAAEAYLANGRLYHPAKLGEASESVQIGDFNEAEENARKTGFVIDGSDVLGYPAKPKPAAEEGKKPEK